MSEAAHDLNNEEDSAAQPVILLVDDHRMTSELERSFFSAAGYVVHTAASPEKVRSIVSKEHVDILMIDVAFAKDAGLAVAKNARSVSRNPHIKVMLTTILSGAKIRQAAKDAGVDKVLVRPAPRQQILKETKGLLHQKFRENERVRRGLIVDVSFAGEHIKTQSLDVSSDGIHLAAWSDRPPLGTELRLSVMFPDKKRAIVFTGTVVRLTDQGVGVRFAELNRTARFQLDKFLLSHTIEGQATQYYL